MKAADSAPEAPQSEDYYLVSLNLGPRNVQSYLEESTMNAVHANLDGGDAEVVAMES
jgi:hypothetical protein